MKIHKILYESPAEIKGEFADIIYFQGCSRNCCFCFNPELRERDLNGWNTNSDDLESLIKKTSSNFVVFTGGEPLEQPSSELFSLIEKLHKIKKKIVLETSLYSQEFFTLVEHVLYSIKTFDVNLHALDNINKMKHVTPVVVTDHHCFNYKGYMEALKHLDEIYLRTKDDVPHSSMYINLYNLGKKYNTNIKRFDRKLCLSKKNLMKL